MIGRVNMLEMRPADRTLEGKGNRSLGDLSTIRRCPGASAGGACTQQDHGLEQALDYKLIDHAREALEHGTRVKFKLPIRNIHRTVGAMLSGRNRPQVRFEGTA